MSLCSSAILMAALTTGVLLSDIAYMRQDRLITHLILGGIITTLFYALCQRGYEMVNWGILLVIPIYMLLSWISTLSRGYVSNEQDDYEVCNKPERRSGCPEKKEDRGCKPKKKVCAN
jgi:hypothetical protein